jgi:hypothetical protein
MKTYQVLSILKEPGELILSGAKTLEIRSWEPPFNATQDLLVVSNSIYLKHDDQVDENGIAIALVDISGYHPWREDEMEKACAKQFKSGYFAWEITNVRPVFCRDLLPAKKGIYELQTNLIVCGG